MVFTRSSLHITGLLAPNFLDTYKYLNFTINLPTEFYPLITEQNQVLHKL